MTANIVFVLVFDTPAFGKVRTGFFQSVVGLRRQTAAAAMLMAMVRRCVNVAVVAKLA
jgi:hypothetical protein